MEENYPTLRVHSGAFSNPGTDNADFRGPNYIGAAQGDHHQTVFEIDRPSQEEIDAWLLIAHKANAKSVKEVAPGIYAGFRMGVWDKTPPAQG